MSKERFKLIPAVYLLLEQDGKLLFTLRQNTGFADGCYALPAGHLDGGEPARLGMCREAKEEIGIDIDPADLNHVLTMHRLSHDREGIDMFFTVKKWTGNLTNKEPEKCAGLEFFAMDALPDNVMPYLYDALKAVAQGDLYMEQGWE